MHTKMFTSTSLLLASVALSFASPLEVRTVAALNTAAFEEAQQRDNTATRAFSSVEIKVRSPIPYLYGITDTVRHQRGNVSSSTNFRGISGPI